MALAAGALSACAPAAVVVVSRAYDPGKTQRVTLAALDDFPASPGSGQIASNTFEKYLLMAGYRLIERRSADQIMKENNFDPSEAANPGQISAAGKLLGVDAMAIGSVTDFTDARDETVMVDMPQEQSDPIYGQVVTTQRSGDTRVQSVTNVVTGYAVTQTNAVVPETQTVPAHVGLSVRLVDVTTGEVLWSVSSSASASDLTTATEQASASAMQAVTAQLKKLAAGH